MKKISVGCGDWHLGWGLGGKNKVGKLSTEDMETFTWDGHSQGRHGQKSNMGAQFVFTMNGETIVEVSRKGYIPYQSELIRGVKDLKSLAIELERIQARRQRGTAKKEAEVKQTKLL